MSFAFERFSDVTRRYDIGSRPRDAVFLQNYWRTSEPLVRACRRPEGCWYRHDRGYPHGVVLPQVTMPLQLLLSLVEDVIHLVSRQFLLLHVTCLLLEKPMTQAIVLYFVSPAHYYGALVDGDRCFSRTLNV